MFINLAFSQNKNNLIEGGDKKSYNLETEVKPFLMV
jgi:hypothetical protein